MTTSRLLVVRFSRFTAGCCLSMRPTALSAGCATSGAGIKSLRSCLTGATHVKLSVFHSTLGRPGCAHPQEVSRPNIPISRVGPHRVEPGVLWRRSGIRGLSEAMAERRRPPASFSGRRSAYTTCRASESRAAFDRYGFLPYRESNSAYRSPTPRGTRWRRHCRTCIGSLTRADGHRPDADAARRSHGATGRSVTTLGSRSRPDGPRVFPPVTH